MVTARLVAHEHHRTDIEGEFLDRGQEQETTVVDRPVLGHRPAGHGVHMPDIARQPGPGERLLHDPAMGHVLVAVHQQQPAIKERPDHVVPRHGREILVPVGEYLLSRVGSDGGDRVQCRGLGEVDRSVFAVALQYEFRSAAEHLDQVAQDGEAGVAHYGFEVAARRGLGEDELVPFLLAQPVVEFGHARDGLQRGRQAPLRLVDQVLGGADSGHGQSSVLLVPDRR